jgi:nitrogen fixation protein
MFRNRLTREVVATFIPMTETHSPVCESMQIDLMGFCITLKQWR